MKEQENSDAAMELLIKALIDGDRIQAVTEARKLCGIGIGHEKIVKEGIEVAMVRLDDICTMEQFNLLQIMLAGRSVMSVMELLYPAGTFPPSTKGTVVLGTLEGDVHDLGKNILKMVMVGKGYRVVDCGKNCPIEKIIDTLEKEDAIAVGISGLITVVVPIVRKVRDIITSQGLGHIKVMAMLALLSGRNCKLLLEPKHQMCAIDCLPMDTQAWSESWGIHLQATIEVVPPLAGFFGSDLLAGVVATHIVENGKCTLFIDFGANSEIALWDGQILRVTSAAGGPAFEGCGISCGMTADPGAIYRFSYQKGSPNFDFDVIASNKPVGLCGSGLVDLIAYLVISGKVTTQGLFAPEITREEFVVLLEKEKIVVSKGDIDVFQQSKAAVCVGIRVLMEEAGMSYNDLERVCVGGAFGYFLNVENAQTIGLLPKIEPHLIELCGNTALAGCEDILLSSVASEHLRSVRDKTRIINPAQRFDFENLF